MKISILIPLLLTACSSQVTPTPRWKEIADEANLPYLNPDLKNRTTAKLLLENGLEVLLLSDPSADQSSALMVVDVGSWSNPPEYPGMAHFCEHMLFMNTKKYPIENEFWTLVLDQKGLLNAYTSSEKTAYFFSSQTPGFLPLLDRWGHFFIDPLFDPSGISRELYAVDQEYAKNIENDAYRQYQIAKETGNQNHPNRLFSCGNAETLGHIPQSALIEWHQQHYGANRMHLFVYSPLSIEEMRKSVVEIFSLVPLASAPLPEAAPLTSPEQLGHITYTVPIKDRRELSLSWELPPSLCTDLTKSADLIAFALNQSTLKEVLKKEELIDDFKANVDSTTGRFANHTVEILFILTEKGIKNVDLIGQRFFEALADLKANSIPSYLFDEMNQLSALSYQYQSREDAFQFLYPIAETYGSEPLATYPRQSLLGSHYSPDTISQILRILTPDACVVNLLASPQVTGVAPDRKERWLGGEYTVRPIPESWIAAWANATPNAAIHLAEPNPYLPQHLETLATAGPSEIKLLFQNDRGMAYYTRAPEFLLPEAAIHLHLSSPLFSPSAKSEVLADLYLDHITDLLQSTLEKAKSAHLEAKFTWDKAKIHLEISGFSEKAPLLLEKIVETLAKTPLPTQSQFDIYFTRHAQSYANMQKELGFLQAKELGFSLLDPYINTSLDKLTALKSLSYEEFHTFCQTLFAKCYVEALFAGNLSKEDASSMSLDLLTTLAPTPYPQSEHPAKPTRRLSFRGSPWSIHYDTSVLGNATFLLLDQGEFSFDLKACQDVLSTALNEPFFSELRTKQRTGYVAHARSFEIDEALYQTFLVQSSSHQPKDLLYRFELFIENFNQNLPFAIPTERFSLLKNNLIESLTNRYRNLRDKTALFDLLAFEKGADFNYLAKRIDALKNLPYDRFLSTSQEWLSRDNRKRLALLFEGKLSSPFTYHEISLTDIKYDPTTLTHPQPTASFKP